MADASIGIDEPGTIDKRVDTETVTGHVDGTVHRERMEVAGAALAAIAAVLNAAPSTEYGLVTRNIPSGTQPVSATDLDIRNLVPAQDEVKVSGVAADGAAVSGNPVLVAGQDGANVQSIKTDAAGELQVDVLTLPSVTIGTFPDNEPFNVAQIGGGAVEVAGTGRQEILAREQSPSQTLLDADGTARTILYAQVNATTDGDNTIVAAVGGQSVYVLGYVLTATGVGTFLLQDTAGTPVVHGRIRAGADGGGASYAGGPHCPAFVTAVGTGFEINVPAGVDVLGHITYMQF